MGLFNMFSENKKQQNKNEFPWISLNDGVQLDEIQQKRDVVVMIFKHSTRCAISRSVINRFEQKYNDNKDNYHFYYLDLLNYRSLSTAIAERFKVIHQSPQLIVIKSGKVELHASHYDILDIDLHT
ncbi:MAG: bacillithiol system redox-active protein YtxJ [Flavobacteriaceae bacterium]|nr:bacillithiol system redox-active protein YtxJ [Flavobacteriaceae bacterium]